MIQSILTALEGHPEWEVAFRTVGTELTVTVFGPHVRNPVEHKEHLTRPYLGEVLQIPVDDAELAEIICRLRSNLLREITGHCHKFGVANPISVDS